MRFVAMLFAVGALLVAAVFAGNDPSDPSTTPGFGTPCLGTETTLPDARRMAAFDLIEAEAPIANPATLRSVWRCRTTAGGIALAYASGASVLESPNDLEDPVGEWNGLAKSYREFSVRTIDGIPASLADPAVDGAIGGVDLVVGEVRYTVSGNGEIPLEDLIDVAESIVRRIS